MGDLLFSSGLYFTYLYEADRHNKMNLFIELLNIYSNIWTFWKKAADIMIDLGKIADFDSGALGRGPRFCLSV